MKFVPAILSFGLLSVLACSQKSSLKGGTNTANIEAAETAVEETEIEAPVAEDAEVAAVIPGDPTRAVGINFEDNYNKKDVSAPDYNDAVLCFEGNFNVTEDRQITSTAVQTIKSKTFSDALCKQKLEITIVRGEERITQSVIPDNLKSESSEVTLEFKVGDKLEVSMIPQSTFPCGDGEVRKHTEPLYSEVKKECNDTKDGL